MDIICARTGHHFATTEDARSCGRNCATRCPFESNDTGSVKSNKIWHELTEYELLKRRVVLPPHQLESQYPITPKRDVEGGDEAKVNTSYQSASSNPVLSKDKSRRKASWSWLWWYATIVVIVILVALALVNR